MTKKQLIKIAKLEIEEWSGPKGLPKGIALIVLFCFIHRVTEGETVEQTFFKPKPATGDYEI